MSAMPNLMQVVVPDADVNSIALITFDRPFQRTLFKSKPIAAALLYVPKPLQNLPVGAAHHPVERGSHYQIVHRRGKRTLCLHEFARIAIVNVAESNPVRQYFIKCGASIRPIAPGLRIRGLSQGI